MTFPRFRKRVSPNPLQTTDASEVNRGGPYQYHMGDLFTPGASIWIFGLGPAGTGIPAISLYGRPGVAGVCCRKYSFDSRAIQVGNVPTYTLVNPSNGGVPVGTFSLTSLTNNQQSAVL